MAYVRKVRTSSGAVAVQVARKNQGKHEILAHLGSAHTDVELGVLLEQARRIADGDQQGLDLEVARKVARVGEVADWRPADETVAPASAGPGHITGTSSRLLREVLGHVYDWLGFDVVDDAVFRDLVSARIVEPTSKLDSIRVLEDLGATTVSYRTIQRHLDVIGPGGYRDAIAAKSAVESRIVV
ncbi:hypothetical protein A5731_27380 [Mycolicibacterium conceptionense]|uniref:Uncharacterized protein n=1 Tax=Mycolicibacterium conceptionense TaxID=451644 RepID=A0A1A1YRL0_9MYCO|nr:hypothetical protein A5718_18605 [Mycolicibacterium conceptionense]TMS45286.1 hypothetical protein E0T84_31275 [Mycobacterium sp. DBP42]UXA21236.1 hypothetical protein KXD98_27445 [Mycobacterium sp. SMC-4]OBE94590.1 hypothetical protein A5731_27380 [Mycolicibacterium conceptionense]OBF21787.1 hypothetical protein A5726_14625 [Mycolicibacterium conceptionense]